MIYVISEILLLSSLEEASKAAGIMLLPAKRACLSVYCLKLPSSLSPQPPSNFYQGLVIAKSK